MWQTAWEMGGKTFTRLYSEKCTRNWEALLRLMEKVQAVGSRNSHKSGVPTTQWNFLPGLKGTASETVKSWFYIYARKTIWSSGKCTALDLKTARKPLGNTHTRQSKARLKPLFGHRRRLRVLRVRVSQQRVFWNRFGSVQFAFGHSSVRCCRVDRFELSAVGHFSYSDAKKDECIVVSVWVWVSVWAGVCVCVSVLRACVRHWRQPAMYK